MKVVFEVENSALDLNLITTLQKSATVNSSVTTNILVYLVTLALLSGKTDNVTIRSPFLRLWHLIFLRRPHYRLTTSMYFLCRVICMQASISECALYLL